MEGFNMAPVGALQSGQKAWSRPYIPASHSLSWTAAVQHFLFHSILDHTGWHGRLTCPDFHRFSSKFSRNYVRFRC